MGTNAIQLTFGVGGFANSSQAGGGDEAQAATVFLRGLKQGQYAELSGGARILTCSIPWPDNLGSRVPNVPPEANPFRYFSSNPTNNPNSFDLSIDVVIAGKTNRISNWSRDPTIVGSP
jgi:hypothetical protein